MFRIALASFLILTSPCLAQAQRSEPIAGRDYPLLGDDEAFAAVTRHPSFGPREEIAFYILRDRRDEAEDRTAHLVARREVSNIENWDAEPEDWIVNSTVSWADEQTCSGLADAVRRMAEVTPPQPLSIGLGPLPEELLITADGVGYELRSQFSRWGSRVGYNLMFSSNTGTPLAAWVEDVRSTAEPCWTSEAPQLPERDPDPTR